MLIFDMNNFDEQRFNLLVGRIANTKNSVKLFLGDSCEGRRYNDNKRIARMLLGYIVEETVDQDGTRNYKAANSKFLSLDTHQIDPYIEKAVQESAGADFHYKFEKEW